MGSNQIDAPQLLQLQSADSLVTLCPGIGGAVARYSWRGQPILRPAVDAAIAGKLVRQMASYPLVPYSNRIGQAILIVDGTPHRLRANAPPEAHALHGFGWQREWQVVSQRDDAADLRLSHPADADWPFDCEATQHLRLIGDALHLRLSVRNTDARGGMPAGLGFHPYFPLDAGTRLRADWTHRWEMDADKLPGERVAIAPSSDFRHARLLAGWQVDHCFTGWRGQAHLEYAHHRVRLEASEDCSRIVCYAPGDGRGFIALEPVSHVNNAFALAASGVADTGMRLLAPGEAMEISLSITPGVSD